MPSSFAAAGPARESVAQIRIIDRRQDEQHSHDKPSHVTFFAFSIINEHHAANNNVFMD